MSFDLEQAINRHIEQRQQDIMDEAKEQALSALFSQHKITLKELLFALQKANEMGLLEGLLLEPFLPKQSPANCTNRTSTARLSSKELEEAMLMVLEGLLASEKPSTKQAILDAIPSPILHEKWNSISRALERKGFTKGSGHRNQKKYCLTTEGKAWLTSKRRTKP